MRDFKVSILYCR